MSTIATYQVDGMTCGNCVKHVTAELSELPGVETVVVDLVAGGTSNVTVTSAEPLTRATVSDAVVEAGYVLTPPRSLL
jgi:copper chaperone CopZ